MRARSWPLIARELELERVAAMLPAPTCGGVLIAGAAGVGKSRLAREALELAERNGMSTVHVLASESAARIPLGALSPLIADLPAGQSSRAELLTHVRAAVAALGGGRRLVLSVDDADRLDPLSAELVAELARAHEVFLVLTIRTDAVPPAAIAALGMEGILEHIELRALSPESVSGLLHQA